MNLLCKIFGHKLRRTLADITVAKPCTRKGCDYISPGIVWPRPKPRPLDIRGYNPVPPTPKWRNQMGKKESTPCPENAVKPDAPNGPPPLREGPRYDLKRVARIFNEWAKRFHKDKTAFEPCLDSEGNVPDDYGEVCAKYFQEISDDLL